LCVEMMSTEKREEHRLKLLAKAQADLEASMGFRLFWNMLTKSNKPLVGHNCFFDLLYVLKNFDAPLPDTLGTLKERFESLFPAGIYDTKFVSDSGILGYSPPDDTSLASLYKSAVTERFGQSDAVIIHDAEFGTGGEESSNKQLHDAGYDSYLTGSIFGQQLFKLGREQIETLSKNRLFMMQSLFHMDLNSSNTEHGFIKIVDRKIYHLSAFADRTSTTDIIKPFTDAGMPLESIEVFWIDQVSTFVFFSQDLPSPLPLPEGWLLKTYEEFTAPPPPPASASAAQEKAEATGMFKLICVCA